MSPAAPKTEPRFAAHTEPMERSCGHAIEGAASASSTAAVGSSSLGALLTRHILRDGEGIILIIKPSMWFIFFSAIPFIAGVAATWIALRLLGERLPTLRWHFVLEAGLFVIAGGVMFAILNWSSRLYVLTDMRILRISGIFNPMIFDCSLRKIARLRRVSPPWEKFCLTGTIEIIPADESLPISTWQTIAKPAHVHETIVAAINKARSGMSE